MPLLFVRQRTGPQPPSTLEKQSLEYNHLLEIPILPHKTDLFSFGEANDISGFPPPWIISEMLISSTLVSRESQITQFTPLEDYV